jgi:membrane associated rhomboid family serine protease
VGACRALQWAQGSPIVTRILLVLTVVCSLVGLVFGVAGYVLNVPLYVLAYFQVYRLLLAPLFESSVLTFVFGVLGYVFMGPVMELKVGSARLLSLAATQAVVTGAAFDVLALLIAYNPVLPMASFVVNPSGGAWLLLVGFMAVDAVLSPDVMRNFCCMNLPNKYIPWVFVGLMVLLSQSGVDLIVACVVGHAYAWGYLDWIKPTDAQLRVWESGWLSSLARQPGFVTVDAAGTSLFVAGQPGDWSRERQDNNNGNGAPTGGGARGNVRTLGATAGPAGGGAGGAGSGGGGAGGEKGADVFHGAGHTVLSAPSSPVVATSDIEMGAASQQHTGASSSQARAAAARAAQERVAQRKRAAPTKTPTIPTTPTSGSSGTASSALSGKAASGTSGTSGVSATAPPSDGGAFDDEDGGDDERGALLAGHNATAEGGRDGWDDAPLFASPPTTPSRPAHIAVPVDQASVDILVSMGFDRDESVGALRATHGDVGSAAALLAQSTL